LKKKTGKGEEKKREERPTRSSREDTLFFSLFLSLSLSLSFVFALSM